MNVHNTHIKNQNTKELILYTMVYNKGKKK